MISKSVSKSGIQSVTQPISTLEVSQPVKKLMNLLVSQSLRQFVFQEVGQLVS